MNVSELITTGAVATVVLYVWIGLSLSAVFGKAGERPWQAWVPILNTIVLLRLGGLSPWLVLLAIVPGPGTIALYVATVVALHRINRAFGLGAGMTVLAAILFPVWASVVGWGSARWLGSAAAPAASRRRSGAESGSLVPEPPASAAPVAPAAGASTLPSVFGAHGPAGGPELPPRPSPPTIEGYPSVVPVPVGRGGVPLPAYDAPSEDPAAPVPAFRSTMQGTPTGFGRESAASEPPARTYLHSGGAPGSRPSFAPDDIDDTAGSSTPAGPPVAARSSAEPWVPGAATPAPAFQPFLGSTELTYESSAEVSAVQGAPTLGAPRAARTSVSAQHKRPEIPDEEGFDETIVAVRRRTIWTLVPSLGSPVPLTAEVVIIGRRPHREPDNVDAQLVAIPDETRTVSKTHARMELTPDGWTIVDLDSTNGVILISEDGAETDATPGRPEPLTARFLLGDAEFGLRREGE